MAALHRVISLPETDRRGLGAPSWTDHADAGRERLAEMGAGDHPGEPLHCQKYCEQNVVAAGRPSVWRRRPQNQIKPEFFGVWREVLILPQRPIYMYLQHMCMHSLDANGYDVEQLSSISNVFMCMS